MTKQEIFDKVTTHLLTQKIAAKEGAPAGFQMSAACYYRMEVPGENGQPSKTLKCAAGVLIPDELYGVWMEDRTVHDADIKEVLVKAQVLDSSDLVYPNSWKPLPGGKFMLISDLQRVHDQTDPKLWLNRLKEIATDYNLKFNWTDSGVQTNG
jgi:hypothetical protein